MKIFTPGLLLTLLSFSSNGHAQFSWDNNLQLCLGLSSSSFQAQIPKFKEKVNDGKTWDTQIVVEKSALTKMINVTCPAYLANPNGDTALTQFRAAFSDVTQRALTTKATANSIQAYFDSLYEDSKRVYLQAGVAFESFPCGKAMKASETHLSDGETFIENQFQILQTKCPTIAKMEAAAAAAFHSSPAPTGQGAPGATEKNGTSKNPASSITGVEDDLKKDSQ
jgi:hypothetical protein